MSIKTRIEALEKALVKDDSLGTVVEIAEFVVRTREQVAQLRAAGVLDSRPDNGPRAPRGPVRVVVKKAVNAEDWLAARDAPAQDGRA
jgi:hypothetical protein